MFEQNGQLVSSIRTHNLSSRPVPIRGEESRIPSQGPARMEKTKQKIINSLKWIWHHRKKLTSEQNPCDDFLVQIALSHNYNASPNRIPCSAVQALQYSPIKCAKCFPLKFNWNEIAFRVCIFILCPHLPPVQFRTTFFYFLFQWNGLCYY